MFRKTSMLTLVAAGSLIIAIPRASHAEVQRLTAQLDMGFGYYQDVLLKKYVNTIEAATMSRGFQLVKSEYLVQDPMNLTFDYHLRFTVAENMSVGISSGVSSLLSNVAVRYKRPIDGASMARTTIHTYLLPQSVGAFFHVPVREALQLVIGAGPSYYLTYTSLTRTVKDGVSSDMFNNYEKKNALDHAAGFNVMLELVTYFRMKYAFTVGLRTDFIFPLTYRDRAFTPSVVLLVGILQAIDM